jgi:hypothetical protein
MEADADESFQMDLEPAEHYLHHELRMQREKARTANRVALVLVVGIIGSLPLYLLAIWLKPAGAEQFMSGYDKWLTIVSTLAGTAIGAYYGSRLEKNASEAKHER